jgi:histone acetyltransferase SAS3
MAAAVLMEEELQNSMATSEEDAEFEEDDELGGDMREDHADSYAANNQLHSGMMVGRSEGGDSNGEEAILSDEDAVGEEDDEMPDSAPHNGEDSLDEDDEDEDGEGVGAVKIQPGLLEDDEEAMSGTGTDDDDDESAASMDDESKDSTDNEVEVEWEPAAEEEEEPANPNRCMCVIPPQKRALLTDILEILPARRRKRSQRGIRAVFGLRSLRRQWFVPECKFAKRGTDNSSPSPMCSKCRSIETR